MTSDDEENGNEDNLGIYSEPPDPKAKKRVEEEQLAKEESRTEEVKQVIDLQGKTLSFIRKGLLGINFTFAAPLLPALLTLFFWEDDKYNGLIDGFADALRYYGYGIVCAVFFWIVMWLAASSGNFIFRVLREYNRKERKKSLLQITQSYTGNEEKAKKAKREYKLTNIKHRLQYYLVIGIIVLIVALPTMSVVFFVSGLTTTLDTITEPIAKNAKKVKDLENEVRDKNSQIDRLEKKVDGQESIISDKDEKLLACERENDKKIKELKKCKENHKSCITESKTKLKKCKDQQKIRKDESILPE